MTQAIEGGVWSIEDVMGLTIEEDRAKDHMERVVRVAEALDANVKRYELAMNLSSLVDVSVQYVMVAYAGTLHHTYGEGKSFEGWKVETKNGSRGVLTSPWSTPCYVAIVYPIDGFHVYHSELDAMKDPIETKKGLELAKVRISDLQRLILMHPGEMNTGFRHGKHAWVRAKPIN
ncbi:hypothetical protein JHK87_043080 [Glycine soja]|nr:hypothetical protein JHK87_043080 [Glycine soja]